MFSRRFAAWDNRPNSKFAGQSSMQTAELSERRRRLVKIAGDDTSAMIQQER
jgi:hypothetical protein